MSERLPPEIKIDEFAYLTCSKCGLVRMCVSLASIAVIKEEYNRPCYSLALCLRCLRTLGRRIHGRGRVAVEPSISKPDIDDMEDSNAAP